MDAGREASDTPRADAEVAPPARCEAFKRMRIFLEEKGFFGSKLALECSFNHRLASRER